MDDNFTILTIDGGAASGKSSTAKRLSQELKFLHIDTGFHYRALTFLLLSNGIPAQESPALELFLQSLVLDTLLAGFQGVLSINGSILEESSLKEPSVNAHVSQYAALPSLRLFLRSYEQSLVTFAKINGFKGLVMDGRDIGSAVFPGAPFKFYLEADLSIRAKRRQAQGIQDSILERDKIDSSRTTTPLTCPLGAHCIDTTYKSLEEVVAYILSVIANKVAE